MARLLIRPQARVDLLEIWHYIAKESIEAANRVGEQLDAGLLRIAAYPGFGYQRADVADDRYLFYSVGKYVIAYRQDGASLIVVRVLHGARDFRKLF